MTAYSDMYYIILKVLRELKLLSFCKSEVRDRGKEENKFPETEERCS